MEIKINIKRNDYVQPTEIREEAVQGICDAFLRHCVDSIFHPFSDGRYRDPTTYIWKYKGEKKFCGFTSASHINDSYSKEGKDVIRINGEEMKTAFEIIIRAGYHIYRKYEYGTWLGYIVDKKPFREDGVEVFCFDHFID